MNPDQLPLLHLFTRLRQAGLPLGVNEFDTLRSKDTLDSADRFRLGSIQSLILATAVKHRLLS